MSNIVGIVGSSKKEGMTAGLVKSCLQAVENEGVRTKLLYLVDFEIKPCRDCADKTCWEDHECRFSDDSQRLQEIIDSSDGLIIGAPVFYHDVNGTTKNFLDKMRFRQTNGKPALAITMAGGTGKGFILALKTLYHFFFCVSLRSIEGLPVTRFNYEIALREVQSRGRKLAQASYNLRPFESLTERICYYHRLHYMNDDIIEENFYLAQLVVQDAKSKSKPPSTILEEAERAMEKAMNLMEKGQKEKAVTPFMEAYHKGFQARHWN